MSECEWEGIEWLIETRSKSEMGECKWEGIDWLFEALSKSEIGCVAGRALTNS